MRCSVCDNLLSEQELGRKYPVGYVQEGEFSDTCCTCTEVISEILIKDYVKEDQ